MAAPSSTTSTQKPELYEHLVDAFNAIFGTHPGYDVLYAKGIVREGKFTVGWRVSLACRKQVSRLTQKPPRERDRISKVLFLVRSLRSADWYNNRDVS